LGGLSESRFRARSAGIPLIQALEVADLLGGGAHLVGQSYGGVVALLAAGASPNEVASLTVVEPPAFALVRGNPDVEALIDRLQPIFSTSREPREFLVAFLSAVGSSYEPPNPLPAAVEASARAHMAERPPWEANVPLAAIAANSIPCLVVSGDHHPAFEAVCDALEQQLSASRAVIRGAGHSVQRTGDPFNAAVTAFIRTNTPTQGD